MANIKANQTDERKVDKINCCCFKKLKCCCSGCEKCCCSEFKTGCKDCCCLCCDLILLISGCIFFIADIGLDIFYYATSSFVNEDVRKSMLAFILLQIVSLFLGSLIIMWGPSSLRLNKTGFCSGIIYFLSSITATE